MGKLIAFRKLNKVLQKKVGQTVERQIVGTRFAKEAHGRMRGLKAVQNTFHHNRKNLNKKFAPFQVTPKLISQAMVKSIGPQGASGFLQSIKMVQANKIKELTKVRREAGKMAANARKEQRRLLGTNSNIDRIVTARGKGIRFAFIRGKVVPIRPKKGK